MPTEEFEVNTNFHSKLLIYQILVSQFLNNFTQQKKHQQEAEKMSSLQDFNATFEKFREVYEECSTLISNGIELETTDENMVNKT